jgi:arginyl-tRNA synthetase
VPLRLDDPTVRNRLVELGGRVPGKGPQLMGTTLTDDVTLHDSERTLVKKLLAFPDEVAEAADRRAPHRMAAYALELAQQFTAFYRDCQVVGAQPRELEDLRLRLCVVTQRTVARALGLLGVRAPQEM